MIWIKRRSEGLAVSSIACLEYDNAVSPYLSVDYSRTFSLVNRAERRRRHPKSSSEACLYAADRILPAYALKTYGGRCAKPRCGPNSPRTCLLQKKIWRRGW